VNYCRATAATMNGTYSMNPASSQTATRSAPASYNGNAWNDLTTGTWYVYGGPGFNGLLNSTNGPTGIGLSMSNFNAIWVDWGASGLNLNLLNGSAAGSAGANFTNIITLSSLNTNHTYDLYFARQHGWNARTTVFQVGTVFKTNTMPSSPYNLGDWAEGTNYVHFAGVRSDASGNLAVNCMDTAELGLNGFQLVDLGPVAPAAPNGLTASGTNGQVNLSWTAPLEATGYNVKRSLTNGGPYSVIGATTGTAYADSAVTNGTWYYYVVSATNNAGPSPNSAQASAQPTAPAIPPVPVLPVSGVTVTNGVPSFSFTAAKGVKYRLDYKNALTDTNWMQSAWSTNATGSDAPMTLTDSTAPGLPHRFYRLEAANP
jgi:hypothetical protein